MQMKELHNTKEKNNDSWSLSLCSQYSVVSTTSLPSAAPMFRTLWSLMRLRFAVRTSPATLNNLFTDAGD